VNKILFYLGMNSACSIHEWNMNFRGENVHFMMTSVCGHVMSLDFVGKFNNWDRVDPVINLLLHDNYFYPT
jgi:DNA topoisomerase III